eukprot:c19238_g1_i3.p1 GENE.c19238_g1_i3~~c19238_g1_i3.p1  ORF type:complete len:785 (+),score=77.24 c19238_g1_i3:3-2357(+)
MGGCDYGHVASGLQDRSVSTTEDHNVVWSDSIKLRRIGSAQAHTPLQLPAQVDVHLGVYLERTQFTSRFVIVPHTVLVNLTGEVLLIRSDAGTQEIGEGAVAVPWVRRGVPIQLGLQGNLTPPIDVLSSSESSVRIPEGPTLLIRTQKMLPNASVRILVSFAPQVNRASTLSDPVEPWLRYAVSLADLSFYVRVCACERPHGLNSTTCRDGVDLMVQALHLDLRNNSKRACESSSVGVELSFGSISFVHGQSMVGLSPTVIYSKNESGLPAILVRASLSRRWGGSTVLEQVEVGITSAAVETSDANIAELVNFARRYANALSTNHRTNGAGTKTQIEVVGKLEISRVTIILTYTQGATRGAPSGLRLRVQRAPINLPSVSMDCGQQALEIPDLSNRILRLYATSPEIASQLTSVLMHSSLTEWRDWVGLGARVDRATPVNVLEDVVRGLVNATQYLITDVALPPPRQSTQRMPPQETKAVCSFANIPFRGLLSAPSVVVRVTRVSLEGPRGIVSFTLPDWVLDHANATVLWSLDQLPYGAVDCVRFDISRLVPDPTSGAVWSAIVSNACHGAVSPLTDLIGHKLCVSRITLEMPSSPQPIHHPSPFDAMRVSAFALRARIVVPVGIGHSLCPRSRFDTLAPTQQGDGERVIDLGLVMPGHGFVVGWQIFSCFSCRQCASHQVSVQVWRTTPMGQDRTLVGSRWVSVRGKGVQCFVLSPLEVKQGDVLGWFQPTHNGKRGGVVCWDNGGHDVIVGGCTATKANVLASDHAREARTYSVKAVFVMS